MTAAGPQRATSLIRIELNRGMPGAAILVARRAPQRVEPPYLIRSRHRDSECLCPRPCAQAQFRRPALPCLLEYRRQSRARAPHRRPLTAELRGLGSPIIYGLPNVAIAAAGVRYIV